MKYLDDILSTIAFTVLIGVLIFAVPIMGIMIEVTK